MVILFPWIKNNVSLIFYTWNCFTLDYSALQKSVERRCFLKLPNVSHLQAAGRLLRQLAQVC